MEIPTKSVTNSHDMKIRPTEKNCELMFKTLRKILNEERANGRYTVDQVQHIMKLSRETLTIVLME